MFIPETEISVAVPGDQPAMGPSVVTDVAADSLPWPVRVSTGARASRGPTTITCMVSWFAACFLSCLMNAATVSAAPPLLSAPFASDLAAARQLEWAEYVQAAASESNSIGMQLTLIPPGDFLMGGDESPSAAAAFAVTQGDLNADVQNYQDEYPQHRVRLPNPFFIGTLEVTRGQFRAFVEDSGYQTEAEGDGKGGLGFVASSRLVEQHPSFNWKNPGYEQTDEHPVVNVSWTDADNFCRWISQREQQVYRLPTEAEWEYSCRAGTTGRLVTGNRPGDLDGSANVGDYKCRQAFGSAQQIFSFPFDDGAEFTSAVGRYRRNPFGLCDMHGNVWEWCRDWYAADYYSNSPEQEPAGPADGTFRVYRGGGWINGPAGCRSARRGGPSPVRCCNRLGFRIVRQIKTADTP